MAEEHVKLAAIQHLILDMDGVLWHGNTPVPGLVAFFATLHRLGLHFALATNNATKTPEMIVARLAGFGVKVPASAIFTSAVATAAYLQSRYPPGTVACVVGEEGLQQALAGRGFRLCHNGAEPASVVVAGLDRQVTYDRLAEAAGHIHAGAAFVGTNPDTTFPSENGPLPGAGAIIAAISAATGVTPVIVGKPGPIMFQAAMAQLGGQPENTAIVGDRLETDILGGKNAGIRTILLLSGIARREDLPAAVAQPDFVFDDLMALEAALKALA